MGLGTAIQSISVRLRSLNCRPVSAEEYARQYQLNGGSFILHPEVLDFLQQSHGVRPDYWGYFKGGQCIGAIATWGTFIAGERYALRAHKISDRIDFGCPILYLPIAPGNRCWVLFRSRFLLNLQRSQIGGALFPKSKTMSLLKSIPDDLLSGKKEFRMKERKFNDRGGEARDIRQLGVDDVVTVYTDLFRQRWGRKPHAIGSLKETLSTLHKFLFGKVLIVNERPIAIQINYRADTAPLICIDYINGGVDKSAHALSPGSLLSYINGKTACEEAKASGRQLVYSYGKSDMDYKDQWCHRVGRGFSGFWLP